MPHAKLFKTGSGGHISIYVPWRPEPIEIMEGGTIETADEREIDALNGSPECVEVKRSKEPKRVSGA
jgi:hypothetical protein